MSTLSYIHCIVTRFSFRFKPDDPTEKLLNKDRLDERLRLFKKYCWSSIINQTGTNFYWVIIIDPLLPEHYILELNNLIQSHKSSPEYNKRGPRNVWLHKWDWEIPTGFKLGEINWILDYFKTIPDPERDGERIINTQWKSPRYLITTRLDDDDCLVNGFINLVQKQFKAGGHVRGLRYLSFAVGYQHYVEQKALRMYRLPMIALGLTLIAEIEKYPICVYLGCHTHIPKYLKDPKKHSQMFKYYMRNKEYPNTLALARKMTAERLWVIKTGGPVWVRNVHDFNLQKNIGRSIGRGRGNNAETVKKIMKSKFGVDI
tara:strand:+ start:95 stop:1042 length:948 start_codon:yes stop_codon:yes gene_type:complete